MKAPLNFNGLNLVVSLKKGGFTCGFRYNFCNWFNKHLLKKHLYRTKLTLHYSTSLHLLHYCTYWISHQYVFLTYTNGHLLTVTYSVMLLTLITKQNMTYNTLQYKTRNSLIKLTCLLIITWVLYKTAP